MNVIHIAGRIGKTPEMKYFESGKCKLSTSLGVQRYHGKDKDKTTDWFQLRAWNRLAEMIGEKFEKGDYLCITGDVEEETWTQDGEKKHRLVVNVQQVHFTPGGEQTRNESNRKPREQANTRQKPASKDDLDAIFPSEDEIPF